METWIMGISPYLLGLIIFITQLIFIFSRTMNVIYTAEHNNAGTFYTGIAVHLSWLLSIAIGVKAVMFLDFFVIFCSLSGGLSGAYWGIQLKKNLNKRKPVKEKKSPPPITGRHRGYYYSIDTKTRAITVSDKKDKSNNVFTYNQWYDLDNVIDIFQDFVNGKEEETSK